MTLALVSIRGGRPMAPRVRERLNTYDRAIDAAIFVLARKRIRALMSEHDQRTGHAKALVQEALRLTNCARRVRTR